MPSALLTPDGLPAQVSEFAHAGATLVREEFGTAEPTFLLLHGLGLGRSVYRELAGALAGRIIGVDLPGFGEAPEPRRVLTMARHADLVAASLRATNSGPVIAIGHSMGSQVAVELAARHPELVSGVVLAAPTVDSRARSVRLQATRMVRDSLSLNPQIVWRGIREYLRSGPHLYTKIRATIAHRPEDAFPALRCPVLIIRGEVDPVSTERWCQEVRSALPGSSYAVIPDHGHETMIHDVDHVAVEITRFVERLSSPASS